jgi:predicted Rossmann-fold nucleotide-binding protein
MDVNTDLPTPRTPQILGESVVGSPYLEERGWLHDIRSQLPNMPFATIFGSSVTHPDDSRIAEWQGLVPLLTEAGIGLISGGYEGSMSFMSERMTAAGGVSIGICTSSLSDELDPSKYSKLFTAPTVFNRLEALLRLGDFFVVLPGGIGTAVELVSAIWLMDRELTARKPIVVLGPHWQGLLDAILRNPLSLRQSDQSLLRILTFVATPDDFNLTRVLAENSVHQRDRSSQ